MIKNQGSIALAIFIFSITTLLQQSFAVKRQPLTSTITHASPVVKTWKSNSPNGELLTTVHHHEDGTVTTQFHKAPADAQFQHSDARTNRDTQAPLPGSLKPNSRTHQQQTNKSD